MGRRITRRSVPISTRPGVGSSRRLLSRKLDLVFTTFIEATGLITTGASISRIIAPILACASQILGGRGAFVALSGTGDVTRVSYVRRGTGARRPMRLDVMAPNRRVAKLSKAARAVVLSDFSGPEQVEALSGVGGRVPSVIVGTGLRHRKVAVGAIGVVVPKDALPSAEDIGLFELLARQAAAAIRNAREFERTQTLSITDGLTGAYNYRFLIDALKKEIGLAQRFREVFSIIMIDVDGLKEYNDVHGHLGGSEVIRQVARVAFGNIRAIDMLCKYGGDEFVALLPRTPKGGAAVLAERLRHLIETHRFPGEEITGKITASFGIASYPGDGATVEELIASADKALYRAKRYGRNLVWLSGKRTPFSHS